MNDIVHHILDLRGAILPYSLLKVSQAFKLARPGEIIEVLSNDPDAQADLFKILPEASYELVTMEEMREPASLRLAFRKKPQIPPLEPSVRREAAGGHDEKKSRNNNSSTETHPEGGHHE